jgi:hypothetical protein
MEKHVELQAFDRDVLRHRLEKDSISDLKGGGFDNDRDRQDQLELARVGKKQVLKVCTHLSWGVRVADSYSVALAWCR